MMIRDRIVELRRVPASQLKPNPRNWRKHPAQQQSALRAVLSEVGFADALLARELEDGSLELIDGHLRALTVPDAVVPVLVLDVTQEEADKILATHDPLAAMAEVDQQQLDSLLEAVDTESPDLQELFDDLAKLATAALSEPVVDVEIPQAYQVVVECRDEAQQRQLYDQLSGQGLRCRVLTL